MSHIALSMIRSEHAALSAMLRSIPMLIDRYRQPGREPDFGALRAILFYIGDYAEQRHHQSFDPSKAERLQREDEKHVERGDQNADLERNAEQQIEADGRADDLGKVGGADGDFGQQP